MRVDMGLFNKKQKQSTSDEGVNNLENNNSENNNQQKQYEERPGGPFIIHLFMEKPCAMPDKEAMTAIMEKHLGDVDCFCHDEKTAGFAPKKYSVKFKEGSMPPQLMVTECISTEDFKLDEITLSQMWDCPESKDILARCKYHVIAIDMLAGAMEDYKERADMLMDFTEGLMEIFPECEAVFFQSSGKMFTREKVINHQIPRKQRFVYFAVNVRFFNIQGTDDMMVDTLGMSTLYLPDLQYHFHGMDPNWVVNHAYNLLTYIYDNNAPIKNGETIDGIADGHISGDIYWKCHYEDSLISPTRLVMDVCMNEYASGKREY